MDSTSQRIIQSMVPQPYGVPPVPELYADTARIDSIAAEQYFGGAIRFNTFADYEQFTLETAAKDRFLFERKLDSGGLGSWVRAVDVARFRFRDFAPSCPVIPSVQGQGFYPRKDSVNVNRVFGQPSPEFAKGKIWYALACGGDGVHLADMNWTGENYGYLITGSGVHSADSLEYGQLSSPNPWINFTTRRTWLGMNSRFDTIRNTVHAVRKLDTLVGWKNLVYNQEQLSAFDTLQSHQSLPLLDSVTTKRCKRYELDLSGEFVDSTAYDSREETYVEITHFSPGSGDTSTWGDQTHYYLCLNKRLWPLDTVTSDTIVTGYGDTVARTRSPFGYIDVRKPVMTFRNSTSVLADSVVIEGLLSGFRDTALFGDPVELNWLKPGSAELYRLTVLPVQLSDVGTAYNNAVHTENPEYDTLGRDRLIVYERDSAVYIRTVDTRGGWSGEVLLSEAADTAVVNGKRVASNFLPALATCRNDTGLTRVVWERRDTLGLSSVESVLLANDMINRTNLAQTVTQNSYRHTLLAPTALEGPENLTPSIVGLHDAGGVHGFVVSWAGPDSGVSLMAVREWTDATGLLRSYDTASTRRIHSIDPIDSLCRYPTLAHVPRYELIDVNTGTTVGTSAEKLEPEVQTGEDFRWYNRVHLAYQQGDEDEGDGQRIYYHTVGAIFPEPKNGQEQSPGLFLGADEEVSKGIDACSFVHPSVAGDSTRIGVAFEIVESGGGQRNIGLRFRDTVTFTQTTKDWETVLYRWGGPLKRVGPWLQVGSIYERPSLTQFPSQDSSTLASFPDGGLAWYHRDGPNGRAHPQWLYRYGWFGSREIGDGKHPTMTLVPHRSLGPFAATSVFHRSDDSSRVSGTNRMGESVYRYGASLLNTPGNPIGYFSPITEGSGIIAGARLFGFPPSCSRERSMSFGFGFAHSSITHPEDDRHGPGDPSVPPATPGLPPGFWSPPGEGSTVFDTLSQVADHVRSSVFVAGDNPVTIRRVAGGGDSLSEWLNTYGTDPLRLVPADIWVVTELVRGSDSVVLWRSDTLTARGLDTLTAPIDEMLSVPVDQVADSGALVWLRMHGFATQGVPYGLHGGFQFYEQDSTTGGGFKRVHRNEESRELPAPGAEGSPAIGLRIVPNPAQDRAEVLVRVQQAGLTRLSVYSAHGEYLTSLPELQVDRAGEYMVEISLANVQPGIYILRAEQEKHSTTAQFSVVR